MNAGNSTDLARELLLLANWSAAPRKTEWGAGMMVADVMISKDETMTLYVHRAALLGANVAPEAGKQSADQA